MNSDHFRQQVTSVADLTALIGVPSELAIKKELTELDRHMRSFIAESPFLLLGTVGRDGRCDVSPRGDAPGVAQVLDSRTLAIPERTGNRRADSLRNIIETGRIGLLFMIPGLTETLRVNGLACVSTDAKLLSSLAAQDKTPLVAIGVEVEECYLQCGKALIRSRLWEQPTSARQSSLPCFAEILADQTKMADTSVESLQQQIDESYAKRLY